MSLTWRWSSSVSAWNRQGLAFALEQGPAQVPGESSGRPVVERPAARFLIDTGVTIMNELIPSDFFSRDFFSRDPFALLLRDTGFPFRLPAGAAVPSIRIDVSEKEHDFLVKADIPGVRKEDIELRIDGAQVTIGVSTKHESEKRDEGRVLWSERSSSYASRTFTLASTVSRQKAQADYKDGVLTVRLPKSADAQETRVAVA
jgi:HSP20 family protein